MRTRKLSRTMKKQNYSKNCNLWKKSFDILLAFLLIAIALLIAVSIYYYLIKFKAKQKHLLPFYVTNTKLKKSFVLIIYYKNGE